jgi:hypothetical protein
MPDMPLIPSIPDMPLMAPKATEALIMDAARTVVFIALNIRVFIFYSSL